MKKVLAALSLKKVIAVFLFGLVAGGVLGAQQVGTLSPELKEQIIAQAGSTQVLIIAAMMQTAFLAAIAALVGLWAAPKVGLNKPLNINGKSIVAALVVALLSASFIAIPEKFIFAKALNLDTNYEFSGLYFLGSLLYGGVIEEILLRLGLMTFIIWLASKATKSTQSNAIYIIGIVIAAFVFAAGHLPATAQMLGLSPLIVTRTLLLNFVPGIGFGYLYWKHGLAYAMLAHIATHIINQLILLPLLF